MPRSERDRDAVRRLLARGYSDRGAAALTGVAQTTVSRWRRSWPPIPIVWRPAHGSSYAYLLGLYLGDGWLDVNRRGRVILRICLRVIEERSYAELAALIGISEENARARASRALRALRDTPTFQRAQERLNHV